MNASQPFWRPDPAVARTSAMARFRASMADHSRHPVPDQAVLQALALRDLRGFWRQWLTHSDLLWDGDPEPVMVGDDVETARFFPQLRLSYAENLLRLRDPEDADRIAVVSCDETGRRTTLTRGALRDQVLHLAGALRALGIGAGDAVAGISGNCAEAVVGCLAATALGAAWFSAAPDLGLDALRERFDQLQPRLLFATHTHRHHGVERDLRPRLAALLSNAPSLRGLVALHDPLEVPGAQIPEYSLQDLLRGDAALEAFPRFPFDHPLFVLFSSGTTGRPKGFAHGLGGTLLEHSKEHALHSALTADDVLYFHTTCGWMMWNWQLSALAQGTTLVLYDGSVSHPTPDALLRLLLAERVTVFGTSPAYLQYLATTGVTPRDLGDWSRLRAIQSTGSILFPAQYDWVREHWCHVPIQSISGGTDILGCFVLGSPELPVYRGESQCISLGLDVRVLVDGRAEAVGSGELVCCNPFPSRPVRLLADPDGARFHQAYFADHRGMWTHGDAVDLTPRGTARMLGRSDGTLNIRGVRIGPAEIYAILASVPEVLDCMALEQRAPHELGGSRLVLLLVLTDGRTLDRPLVLRLKKVLHDRGSPNHVPAVVAQVRGVPTTFNGKKSELAASDALCGREAKNRSALKNPETLDEIAAHPDLRVPPS